MAHPGNWHWRTGPVDPGPAVVFDVDGVISDASDRQHHLAGPTRRWEDFFAACGADAPIREAFALAEVLRDVFRIVSLTARPIAVQSITREWLDRHGFPYDLLIMREHHDHWSSTRFKAATVETLVAHGFDIRLVLDDDPRNIEMFRSLDLPTLYVHSGYYE